MRNYSRGIAGAIAVAAAHAAHAGPQIDVNPWFPAYAQPVQIELRGVSTYLPATRYARTGNTFVLEYEQPGSVSAARADFGSAPLALGELAPGNYRVLARIFDMSQPFAAPVQVEQQVQVAPPDQAGVYVVPRMPSSYQPLEVVIRGEYQFDPTTLRASVSNGTIRVDYTYSADMPASEWLRPGMAYHASIRVAGVAPGTYKVEAVGSDRRWSTIQNRLAGNVAIGGPTRVVEFYAPSLDHYFMSAWPDEVAGLDNNALGWQRTGQYFNAWLRQDEAPQGAVPVCRFYASGPNSHFYTADPSECQSLKSLEQVQRAEAQSKGVKFTGWQFEMVAFYAFAPQGGACPAGTQPVYRDYNMRGDRNDSNHRFVVNPQQRVAMKAGNEWTEEGVAFCSPL